MVQQKQAFTLIELLVVVLIIGILAAVALPQYQKAVLKSRYSTMKPIVKALIEAEEVYYLANGDYTLDLTELDVELPTPDFLDTTSQTYPIFEYKWGKCFSNLKGIVTCKLTPTSISYAIGALHLSSPSYLAWIGKQVCQARTSNIYAKQICQQESGAITPSGLTPTELTEYYVW